MPDYTVRSLLGCTEAPMLRMLLIVAGTGYSGRGTVPRARRSRRADAQFIGPVGDIVVAPFSPDGELLLRENVS
jgi:hypothetical protein